MRKFFCRIGHVILGFLRIIDITLCWLWLSPLYLFQLAERPTGRQLISGYVGKGAYYRRPWALRMERIIDWLARKLGDGPGHCRRAYEFYRPVDIGY